MRRAAFLIALATIVGVVTIALRGNETPVGRGGQMCPPDVSAAIFDDARRFCATRATALASIDAEGIVTRYVGDVGCTIPSFEATSADRTQVIGHGARRCDTSTVGTTLYVFPHCSLVLNYPGNGDYRAAMPIGLLVEPYDC